MVLFSNVNLVLLVQKMCMVGNINRDWYHFSIRVDTNIDMGWGVILYRKNQVSLRFEIYRKLTGVLDRPLRSKVFRQLLANFLNLLCLIQQN